MQFFNTIQLFFVFNEVQTGIKYCSTVFVSIYTNYF